MTSPVARRALVLLMVSGATVASASCSTTSTPNASSATDAPARHLTVYAASSLTESFTLLGRAFETAHPGVTVTFSFGPSSGLATQIVEGAPADVFASASPTPMASAVDAKAVGASVTFATNALAIAVPKDNPASIERLDDLDDSRVTVALCDSAVPCGALADTVLAKANVTLTPVSREVDVKAVLTKVRAGEVDAGLVYVTDVRAAGSAVGSVSIPAAVNGATAYPIGVVSATPEPVLAEAFVAMVTSAQGQSVLQAAGFGAP